MYLTNEIANINLNIKNINEKSIVNKVSNKSKVGVHMLSDFISEKIV